MIKKVNSEYARLRIGLIKKGTNFWRWSKARRHNYTTVICAANKTRAGIKSVKILKELEDFINA